MSATPDFFSRTVSQYLLEESLNKSSMLFENAEEESSIHFIRAYHLRQSVIHAPAYIKNEVMTFLKKTFSEERLIIRTSTDTWSSLLPDLTSVVFWFLGFVDSRISRNIWMRIREIKTESSMFLLHVLIYAWESFIFLNKNHLFISGVAS